MKKQKRYERFRIGWVWCFLISAAFFSLQYNTIKSEEFHFDLPETLPYPEYVERDIVGYPQELYWGDCFYLKGTQKNISKQPFLVFDAPLASYYSRRNVFLILTSDVTDEKFCYYPAGIYDPSLLYSARERLIRPGHSVSVCYPMEIPSQEGMLHPFWKTIKEKLTPEGVKCKLTVMLTDNFVRFPERYTGFYPFNENIHVTSHEILIKPRPEKEMLLLREWQENFSPSKLTITRKFADNQEIVWYTDTMHLYDSDRRLYKKDVTNVDVNGQGISVFQFRRATNSWPPVALRLNTLDKWKNLEDSFSPSTLRDEIQWVRMQLDYHNASDSERPIRKKELMQWISTLPDPQQTALVSGLANQFYKKFFRDENETESFRKMKDDLIKSFYGKMTTDIQIQCVEKLSELQHPWGEQDVRPYVYYEILDPPEEYLSLRNSNKTDEGGFRLWKFGIYYFKAKYEGKTEQGDIILKDRFGSSYAIPLKEFEETDLKYLDEKAE